MNRRSGFTLIEVLISVTIVSIVAWLLLGMSASGIAGARNAATQATIAKLDSVLQERLREFRKRSLKSAARTLEMRYGAEMPPNAPPVIPEPAAEALARMIAFREAFPQRLEDLFGIDGIQGTADDASLLSVWLSRTAGVLRPSGHRPEHESSKLLHLMLTTGRRESEVLDSINPRHIRFVDLPDEAAGLYAFVDDWGVALRFYNCPTRFPWSAETPTGHDPLDPRGHVARFFSISSIDSSPFRLAVLTADSQGALLVTGQQPCRALDVSQLYDVEKFHTPLILSAGEDGEFGLELTTATGGARLAQPMPGAVEARADNLTNLQRRP